MRLSRHSRVVTALIALFSVLFMQLAAAAYACPAVQGNASLPASPNVVSAAEHDGMIGCEGVVDIEQPALCYTHAQEGSQSLNKPPVPDVQPTVAVVLVPAVGDTAVAFRPVTPPAQANWLTRASDPPLSIRNCCFRI